jgi:hypothetical protein
LEEEPTIALSPTVKVLTWNRYVQMLLLYYRMLPATARGERLSPSLVQAIYSENVFNWVQAPGCVANSPSEENKQQKPNYRMAGWTSRLPAEGDQLVVDSLGTGILSARL